MKNARSTLPEGPISAPGIYDALGARLAELTGFPAVYLSGYAFEGTQLGAPDIGLMTLTELASQVARISDAVDIPIICDVDTGFGGINNVWRTVNVMERSGAAAIQIEDQAIPKRCPVVENKQLVSRDAALGRIQAAVEARDQLQIIARTDADDLGFDELVTRCRMFLDAGADIAFPMVMSIGGRPTWEMAPDDEMEWRAKLAQAIDGPLLTVDSPAGFTAADMHAIGYDTVIMPALLLQATLTANLEALRSVQETGSGQAYSLAHPTPIQGGLPFLQLLGLDEHLLREERFDRP